MIPLGLRLTIAGGREAFARLAVIAVAVAIGTGLLLTVLAGLRAVDAQNARYAWLETGYLGSNAPALTGGTTGTARTDPLWWSLRADQFQGERIGRLDVAATGPDSPVPPGIPRLPGPGEFYASPALAKLLSDIPAAQLADRYPGAQVGVIGAEALPSPDSLIVVLGRTPAEVAHEPNAVQVDRISTTVPSSCTNGCALGVGFDSDGITLILSVVVAALLFPVLIFIGGATRLSAARREQRFAAMRLVGATPRQVATIATVESSLAAVVGVALGIAGFVVLRPVVAGVPFTGDPFFTGDLTPSPVQVLLVAVGVPAAGAVAARLALRRVTVSPLGVRRRVTPKPPRAWRVLPLAAGVAWLTWLAYSSDIGASENSMLQAYAYLAGIFLVMGGLVMAGPWLTMLGSNVMVRLAVRPATLIAARRLADDPTAGFRAVRGLVLAVFVATCAVATIGTILAGNGGSAGDRAVDAGTVVANAADHAVGAPSLSAGQVAVLAAVPGVRGVTGVHSAGIGPGPFDGLIVCADLARTPALGRCPSDAETVEANPRFGGGVVDRDRSNHLVWPASDRTAAEVATLPVTTVVVATDGSRTAVEQVRTLLGADYPTTFGPETVAEIRADGSRQIRNYQQLANVVVAASLPIAGCSLAVSVVAGVADRRRPFSLLRLTGAPLAVLRRVVLLESAVPLLVTAALSAGAALLCAHLFVRAQLGETLRLPGLQFSVLVVLGLAASLALIASTLPFLARTTGPEVARNG